MKTCSSCKNTKDYSEFTKNKSRPDGYHTQCKSCRKEYYDRVDYGKVMYARPETKKRMDAKHAEWQAKNRDKYNEYMRNWNKENKNYSDPKILAYGLQRRTKQANGTPPWVDKDHNEKIARFYELAKTLNSLTGEKFEVDHIYPVTHKELCGLHVWWNLQLLPKVKNRSKGNKLPDENITSPRVSEDSFEEYLQEQFKIYADLYQIKGIELGDKKPLG